MYIHTHHFDFTQIQSHGPPMPILSRRGVPPSTRHSESPTSLAPRRVESSLVRLPGGFCPHSAPLDCLPPVPPARPPKLCDVAKSASLLHSAMPVSLRDAFGDATSRCRQVRSTVVELTTLGHTCMGCLCKSCFPSPSPKLLYFSGLCIYRAQSIQELNGIPRHPVSGSPPVLVLHPFPGQIFLFAVKENHLQSSIADGPFCIAHRLQTGSLRTSSRPPPPSTNPVPAAKESPVQLVFLGLFFSLPGAPPATHPPPPLGLISRSISDSCGTIAENCRKLRKIANCGNLRKSCGDQFPPGFNLFRVRRKVTTGETGG